MMDGRLWPAQIPGHAASSAASPTPDQTVSSLPAISSLAAPTDAWYCTIFQPPERRARVAVILSMTAEPLGKNDIRLHGTPADAALGPALGMAHRRCRALKFCALRLRGPEQIVRVVPPLRGVCAHHQHARLC